MKQFGIGILAASTLLAGVVVAFDARAQYAREGLQLIESPDFRTDLGAHLAIGANTCIAGGSGYADCNDVNHSWDTSIGFAAGLIVRPYSKLSFGIDVAYQRMVHHQYTDDHWGDVSIGPTVRGYLPLYISGVLVEPNLGLQLGYVNGKFLQKARGSTEKDYNHRHVGLFFSAILGVDIFIPRTSFGIGVEARMLRTLYQEVCFEWSEGTNCRGVSDENIERTYDVQYDEDLGMEVVKDGTKFPGEKGIASYPWKLFYGLHIIYYF